MKGPNLLMCIAAMVVAGGCAGEPAEEAAAPPNPIERRVEPVRDRAAEADSLMRVREREVRELTGG